MSFLSLSDGIDKREDKSTRIAHNLYYISPFALKVYDFNISKHQLRLCIDSKAFPVLCNE